MKELHIIEPTLNKPGGHCFTIAHTLLDSASRSYPGLRIHLWCGKNLPLGLLEETNAHIHRYFSRRLRRFQLWRLLRKLQGRNRTILLPTAGRPELTIVSLLPRAIRLHLNIWFFVHQMRMDESRKKRLALLAKNLPDAQILCTHIELETHLREAGFVKVRLQPCPFIVPEKPFDPEPFRSLIAPGEARPDKNLGFLAKILAWLQENNAQIPVFLQVAPNHHNEFAFEIQDQLKQIESIGYPLLSLAKEALSEEAYLEQFKGAICLQPYRRQDYAGKISGITLDALSRGAPCITTEGTWPAEVVAEFGAGIVCREDNVESWGRAIEQGVTDYARLQDACRNAYKVLAERHHPKRTLETILGD